MALALHPEPAGPPTSIPPSDPIVPLDTLSPSSPLISTHTTNTVLPDIIPPDLLIILIEHLLASNSLGTLSNLQQTSKTNYDLITPFLHETRTLGTGSFTVLDIFDSAGDKPPTSTIQEEEQKARSEGWYFSSKGSDLRRKVGYHHTKHLVVPTLPAEAAASPANVKPPPTPLTTPLPNVSTVTIAQPVLHDLSLFFSAFISENFLRPLSQLCAPSHLILRHPDDTALGSYKHMLNLLDELRWPQLTKLTMLNIGAHALPSRPGLSVTVQFASGVPIKWESGPAPRASKLRKYERSRLTQILMAVPRSVRVREGVEGLGEGTKWKFVGAGRFLTSRMSAEKLNDKDNQEEEVVAERRRLIREAEESTERLKGAVEEWALREYTSAGWSKEEVEVLLRRIQFVV